MRNGLLISTILVIFISACRLNEQERTGPLHIVATTGIIEDGLKQIVGDSAEVSALMGPGTDPHLYKPTPFDVELLEDRRNCLQWFAPRRKNVGNVAKIWTNQTRDCSLRRY